ncbi:MAG: FAD-dependent oxidoreductase [Desulfovibrionales bacterium]|nr:FAD-dependent oxidoreductase [Desulfovibrionales bacterium]
MRTTQQPANNVRNVAVIGAGPSGIACARYLIKHGATVTVFERHSDVGGQWDCSSPYSAVWPSMHTNTCSLTTRFSDMEHSGDTAMFPANEVIHTYLREYADTFRVLEHILFSTEVLLVSPADAAGAEKGAWRLVWFSDARGEESGFFDAVVVASGRCSVPNIPVISGIESFCGDLGVIHSSKYRTNDTYEGKRVVVAGGSTSGCEIASDIASREAEVISSVRRARYVFQRIMGGRPAEYINLTRFGMLWSEVITPEEDEAEFKEFITSRCGRPDQYGGLTPHDDIMEAGATMSQEYLLFIAEDRIVQKPWIRHIAGQRVYFDDGTAVDNVDGLILCTGFDISLPFLDAPVREVLKPKQVHLPLAWYTMHPDLPELYFAGFGLPNGSMFLVAEQQARFIAYQCCDVVRRIPKAVIKRARSNYMATPHLHGMLFVNRLTIQHARLSGFEADMAAYPELARYLLFGPLTPATFRLSGVDALPDGAERVVREAHTYSQMTSPRMTGEEQRMLRNLAERKNDPAFSAIVLQILKVQQGMM